MGPVKNAYIFYSLFFVISIGQKPIPQRYGHQRPHDQDIGNAFGVKHIFLQRMNGTFHIVTLKCCSIYFSSLNPIDPELSMPKMTKINDVVHFILRHPGIMILRNKLSPIRAQHLHLLTPET